MLMNKSYRLQYDIETQHKITHENFPLLTFDYKAFRVFSSSPNDTELFSE